MVDVPVEALGPGHDVLGDLVVDAQVPLAEVTNELDERGDREVAGGFAGPLAQELPPGTYKVVVEAGDHPLTKNVTITPGVDAAVKVSVRAGLFELR